MKNKGFGLIGLIITIAIIALLVFGATKLGGTSQKNQIESGQDAIKQAQDAADKEKADSQSLQDEVNNLQPDLSPDIYHSIQDRAKNFSQ